MRILRIVLSGASVLLGRSKLELNLSSQGQTIITGPNGSGKSLLVSSLLAAFSTSLENELISDLVRSGLDDVEIEFMRKEDYANLTFSLSNRERVFSTQRPDGLSGLDESSPGHHTPGMTNGSTVRAEFKLFDLSPLPELHFIRSGVTGLIYHTEFLKNLTAIARIPLEHELDGWNARLISLTGDAEHKGKLAEIRLEHHLALAELHRVEGLWIQLADAKTKKTRLEEELFETIGRNEIFAAEYEELQKLASLADRALRLHDWLQELNKDHEAVITLRELHLRYQERLDVLSARFRNIPEDFPAILHTHVTTCAKEQELAGQLKDIEARQEQVRNQTESLEKELSLLVPPDEQSFVVRHEKIQQSIESSESELVEILRRRITLLRQREGVEQQLKRDFPLFLQLDSTHRTVLQNYIELRLRLTKETEEKARSAHMLQTNLQKQGNEIRNTISASYDGYDRLPEKTPVLLRELFERRNALTLIMTELQQLRALTETNSSTDAPVVQIAIGGAVAVSTFSVVTYFAGWDIGLLAGLLSSGLVLLAGRFTLRAAHRRTESVLNAQESVENRLKECMEEKEHLEILLQPLSRFTDYDSAVGSYWEYQRLQSTLLSLSEEISSETATPILLEDSELRRLEKLLPNELIATDPVALQVQFDSFQALMHRSDAYELEWLAFANGGEVATRIGELESRISHLKHDLSELVSQKQQQSDAYNSHKTELEAKIEQIRKQDASPVALDSLRIELAGIKDALSETSKTLGGILTGSDPVELEKQWEEMNRLRSELRDIRDKLSAHQSLDEIRARQSFLNEEFEQIKEKLCLLDPLYLLNGTVSDYATKYMEQVVAAQRELLQNRSTQQELREQCDTIDLDALAKDAAQEKTVDELKSWTVECAEHLESIEREIATAQEMISSVKAELDELQETFQSNLEETINSFLSTVSEGRMKRIVLNDGVSLELADGTSRPLHLLSGGLTDLIWLVVRLAILHSIRHADCFPIIWDDALTRLDSYYLQRLRVLLEDVARSRQVILLSKDSNLEAWGHTVRLPATTNEMIPLSNRESDPIIAM